MSRPDIDVEELRAFVERWIPPLTQDEVAKAAHISRGTVSNFLRGKRSNRRTLKALQRWREEITAQAAPDVRFRPLVASVDRADVVTEEQMQHAVRVVRCLAGRIEPRRLLALAEAFYDAGSAAEWPDTILAEFAELVALARHEIGRADTRKAETEGRD